MRRADRLFQIIQIIRSNRLITAQQLAEQLEVSIRTVYRDINDLIVSGVPIYGEAGVGYTLRKGYDLPPLMFSEDEIAAITLGARIVGSWTDDSLSLSAKAALQKIEQVLPGHLKAQIELTPLFAVNFDTTERIFASLKQLRQAIAKRNKVALTYVDKTGSMTTRLVRPLSLTVFGSLWTLNAWCERRNDFRNFRLDRICELHVNTAHFSDEPGKTIDDLLAKVRNEKPFV
ncbi:MAG: YafY family transcriptional regulator [Deltaproteobacteria bacterium]|nr:YafY family transcriptional regulator [Deltaproteobacteria bacterium]